LLIALSILRFPQPKQKIESGKVAFWNAMTAPSLLPEFKGNVMAVPTAPFWSEELAAIEEKRGQIKAMANTLKNKSKNGPNKDGTMTAPSSAITSSVDVHTMC
jgi:hypothetical protein